MHLPTGTTLQTADGVTVEIVEKRRYDTVIKRLDNGEQLPNVSVESLVKRITDGRLQRLD